MAKKRKYVPRNTLQFQMNLKSKMDLEVISIYEAAAKNYEALMLFRGGMRLMWALSHNDLSVLFELFPHLQSRFIPEPDDLIEQFRSMLSKEIANIPVQMALPEPPPNGIKPIAGANKVQSPTFEDDDEVVIRRDTKQDGAAASNFLDSLLHLQDSEGQHDG